MRIRERLSAALRLKAFSDSLGDGSSTIDRLAGPESQLAKNQYDLVIVHGGGLHRTSSGDYYPSDYRDQDRNGMLGAGMRVAAALEMYLRGQKKFVFTGGVSEKNRKKFGDNCPTEADVYAEKFVRMAAIFKGRNPDTLGGLEDPIVLKESESINTKECIKILLDQAKIQGLQNIAVISNEYHLPRMRALYNHLSKELEVDTDITFISAEIVMNATHPGRYDRVIDRYYQSKPGKRRKRMEKLGVLYLNLGLHRDKEFRLPWGRK